MTVLERLGAHAAGGYRHGLSDSTRDAARLHVADTVGAWIAAGSAAEGRALLRFQPSEWKDVPGRVALNCALARLSEIDDIHLASGTTPGALIVPAALTIGGSNRSSGAAVAEAIAIGYDAIVRLGAALDGARLLYRGIWPTYFVAPFGVAATAARLLDLTATQSAHALAVALGLAAPSVGRQSGASTARWLAIGNAARNGAFAAVSARAGFTGDLRLFESEFFSAIYGVMPDVAALAEVPADRPALPETGFKPWCAARQTMAAAQALLEIVESGVAAREISGVLVSVPSLYLKMIDHGIVAGDRGSRLTSVSYQTALAALAPEAMLDVGQDPHRIPAEIGAFMERVAVKADDELLRHYPVSWPARVEIRTSAGRRERLVTHVPGDAQRPFGEAQVAEKFRRLTVPLLGQRAADELLSSSFEALDKDDGPRSLLGKIEGATAIAGGAG
jgi:2-methylcitrate dehydratase PrpD